MLVAQEMSVIYKQAAQTLDVETATFAKSPLFNQPARNSGITGPPALKKWQLSKILHSTQEILSSRFMQTSFP